MTVFQYFGLALLVAASTPVVGLLAGAGLVAWRWWLDERREGVA